ncbi:MAG: ribose-5-phosphate isomerase RpiA [Euryarchaeota archaeon]|nr:ribose-5-phosphate isomerase RpiA [Euryarchaeota archaeon]
MDPKTAAGEEAAKLVVDGMFVGLGTGSTAEKATRAIGRRVAEGLKIKAVATSKATSALACKLAIPLLDVDMVDRIDVTIDGADEVDPNGDAVKGLGGALFREKVVASITKKYVIIIDGSKLVDTLGTKAPVPVEVSQYGARHAASRLERLGCDPKLRGGEKPFVTDNGNYIVDCRFNGIRDPAGLNGAMKSITGVLETGLFLGMKPHVIVGSEDGARRFTY